MKPTLKDVKKLVLKETPKAPQKIVQDNNKDKKPTAQDLYQEEKDKNKNEAPAVNPTNAAPSQQSLFDAPDMPQASVSNSTDGDKPTPAPGPEITPPGDTPPPIDNPAENNPKMHF